MDSVEPREPAHNSSSSPTPGGAPSQSRPVVHVVRGADSGAPSREPVTLVKGPHKWTFACDPGDEPALLRRLSELASGADAPFDWFDAALVSHQLSRRLKSGLFRIDGGDNGTSS